ncbi:MAG TPA: D-cysteine desulfhydrase family protein [Ignavibacteriales bacterium]|nr:D-cysteine desulfhydrase family protein [Ignavibacteriales bacterium]
MKIPPKLGLANLPTPIQEISFRGKKFLVKRDDLTGMELSGNKVRKLEYILAQAKKEKAEIVFTCGGEQSNHARATAIAASKIGMKCKLFLWGNSKTEVDGNLFLDKLTGCEISFLNKVEYLSVNEIMFEERKKLLKKGKKVYVIPEGGSTTLGIWGYITFVQELNKQIDLKKIDGIVTAAGSGGTAAGLILGSSLLKLDLKIFAVNVLYSESVIKNKIIQLVEAGNLDYQLGAKIYEDNMVILDGYSKEGYKNISKEKVKLVKSFFRQTGILLDPAYTGKAFAAFNDNFLGKNIGKVIFLHTGGLFGIFGKRKEYLIA